MAVCAILLFCPPGPATAESRHFEGESLFVEHKCVRCHTVGRGRFVGPDLKGVFGRYERERVFLWITDPSAVYKSEGRVPVNEGYPPMPQTEVNPEEAEKIADYLLSLQSVSESQDGGTVGGKVVNETTEKPAVGIEVMLGSFLGDSQISSRSEKTGTDGGFRFKGLEWTAAHKISITLGGVFYETDKMVFKPEQTKIDVSLPVYETGADDGQIGVELNHLIVQPPAGSPQEGISIAEFVEFINRGNTAVISNEESGQSATLRFGVPETAEGLNFIHGADPEGIFKQNGGFSVLPVLPGLKRTVFSYRIPFEGGILGNEHAAFTKTLQYATSSFVVIAPASGGVAVEGLGAGKKVTGEDGRVFSRWDGAGLEKGDEVRISVSLRNGKRPAWILPVAVFALVLAVAGLYGWRRAG